MLITALRAPQIQEWVEHCCDTIAAVLTISDLASLQSPDYSGKRLIACRNSFLASLRAATSEALLQATEKELKNEIKLSQSQHPRVVGWCEQKKLG